MNAHKVLPVIAAVGLAIGLAGCSSSAPKAASESAHRIPSAVQMSQEKQAQIIEHNVKVASDYVAKVKAEKEAQTKAGAKAQTQADGQPQGGVQPQARSGSNYQARSNYQALRRSGGNSGGGSGGNNWPDYLEIEIPVAQEGEPDPCRWVDTDGNRWTTDHC